MNVVVLSDIHGNIEALKSVISDMKTFDISYVLFLGDLVINGPAPLEVYQEMCKLSPRCWVLGNTDDWFVEINVNWSPSSDQEEILYQKYKYACKYLKDSFIAHLINRPKKCSLETGDLSILSVHGSPRSYSEGIFENTPHEDLEGMFSELKENFILCGHTHVPMDRSIGKLRVVNAGSVGLPFDGDPRACYAVISTPAENGNGSLQVQLRRVAYNVEKVVEQFFARDHPAADVGAFNLRTARSIGTSLIYTPEMRYRATSSVMGDQL